MKSVNAKFHDVRNITRSLLNQVFLSFNCNVSSILTSLRGKYLYSKGNILRFTNKAFCGATLLCWNETRSCHRRARWRDNERDSLRSRAITRRKLTAEMIRSSWRDKARRRAELRFSMRNSSSLSGFARAKCVFGAANACASCKSAHGEHPLRSPGYFHTPHPSRIPRTIYRHPSFPLHPYTGILRPALWFRGRSIQILKRLGAAK